MSAVASMKNTVLWLCFSISFKIHCHDCSGNQVVPKIPKVVPK